MMSVGNEIKVRKGVLVSQDASGGATLVVEKCTSSDAGVYTAKGTNDVGECSTSCTVTVTQAMEEPKFTSLLRSAKADDKGAYVAIAYNSEGTARSLANVAIKTRLKEGVETSAPSFARPLGDISVDEGQKLRITTPVRGNPIPEFSWTKNGKPIDSSRIHFFSDGELIGLEIIDAKIADSGAYECHLSNQC